jgi:hypothetical protein
MARQAKYGPYNYERTLGTRNYHFTADVDAFVQGTRKRMRALVLQSTEDLINQAQTPVAKGGKMRVDTGFLRASGQISLTGMPAGSTRGEDGKRYRAKNINATADLAGFTLGETIYFGWTAEYAKYREAYDGFLFSAIQNWQTIVNKVAEDIKRRSPANRTPAL